MNTPRDSLRWNGWGRVDAPDLLTGRPETTTWLAQALGMPLPLPHTPVAMLDEVRVPMSRLSAEARAALADILPTDANIESARERTLHARGRSYADLLQLRAALLESLPDAVVYPASTTQAAAVVQWAQEHQVCLVPFGGGSSVVGGVNPPGGDRPAVVVDMNRMHHVLSVDALSLTATAETGVYGPHLERQLAEHGVTLGHYPQSFEYSTLGGWIAARGSGQFSNRSGGAARWVVGADLATPRGVWRVGGFPASAAGPDLLQLIVGSEGTLGLLTTVTVRVRPVPALRDFHAWLLPTFEGGVDVMRRAMQAGVPAAMLRLCDAEETHVMRGLSQADRAGAWGHRVGEALLRLTGMGRQPCLLLAVVEGEARLLGASARELSRLVRAVGGMGVGARPARRWYATRFDGGYLRDALLDRGIGVETFETATRWSNIEALRVAITSAMRRTANQEAAHPAARAIVMTHISHAYADGASLYFTLLFPRARERELEQWRAIKVAVTETVVSAGGTVSHHHGIGEDHAPWMSREKGELGMDVLRAIKRTVDPDNIMNPGKLLG